MPENAELQSPSPEPAAAVAGDLSRAPSSTESEEHAQDGRSWWSRLWSTRGHHADDVSDASPDGAAEGQEEAAAPARITLTEEELQQRVTREAQSRIDRETARRNREAAEAERRRLREEDPWTFAQQDRQREEQEQLRGAQTQQLIELLGHTARQHDSVSVDPVLFSLPKQEQERILALPNAGLGLDGRKLIVSEALKTYGRLEYERGVRETQAKLRKDPVFRKSVLAEFRGLHPEPELYPGESPRESPEDNVSNRLRSAFYQR